MQWSGKPRLFKARRNARQRIYSPNCIVWIQRLIFDTKSALIASFSLNKTPSDKYFASILCETEDFGSQDSGDKTLGINFGLKDFAIVHDGEEVTKYSNPKHLKRHKTI